MLTRIAAMILALIAAQTAGAMGTDVDLFSLGPVVKGRVAIEQILHARLLKLGNIELAQYTGYEVAPLLGTYDGDPRNHFKNGSPNGINMLLWYMAFSGLGNELGQICSDPGKSRYSDRLNDRFSELMSRICQWPALSARNEATLLNLWTTVVGFDAPWGEFEAWRDFFLSSHYAQTKPNEAFAAIFVAMTMNPYFLLKP